MARTSQTKSNTATRSRRRVKGSASDDGRKPATTTAPRTRKKPSDPWLEGLGMFKDDPTFVPMIKEIYRKHRSSPFVDPDEE